MNALIAILTPDAAGAWHQSRWRDVLGRMTAPLETAGLQVEDCSWTAAGDLKEYDLVMPLLVWGYHRDADWQAQVRQWEREGVPLQNPPSVLCWNADKAYLGVLEGKGVAITPTIFVDRIDEATLFGAAEQFGTDRLIAKPRISAGAFQTIRWSPGTPLNGGPEGAAMIQPYLPAIQTTGEISLIYFDGGFSHAISKVPQPGDFRVQPEYDGIITAHQPAPDELAVADAVLAAAGEELLYARVDLVRDLDGDPVLMELELVEPDLYLGHDPEAPARFANAIVQTVRRRSGALCR